MSTQRVDGEIRGRTRRRAALGGAAGVSVALGLLVWLWYLPTREAVGIGAAMLAKQVCSCIHVAGRDLDACRADQFESMDPIRVEVLDGEDRVRAFVPGFGGRTAAFRAGFGCHLE